MEQRIENLLTPRIKGLDVSYSRMIPTGPVRTEIGGKTNKVRISENGIFVNATGIQTARQGGAYIEQLSILFGGMLPVCEFEFHDPAWGYRGFHIDVVRHFIGTKELKRIIKAMALVGYNHFHWHLTDDQGWRFSVPGYDRLESVSSKRVKYETDDERNVHKGFYSDEDLKEIVTFCTGLGIEVIPEIEMPGHAQALLAAYPEFGCTGKAIPVQSNWGVFHDVMNPASEELWTFLKMAIGKLVSVFPGQFIHIGGDECPHDQWEDNPQCRALMRRENLKDTDQLQGYFTTRAALLVKSFGRRAIGWDEVVDSPNIDKSVVVMSWRGLDGAKIASLRGHEVILSPQTSGCYFDRYQSSEPWEIGNISRCTARDVYDLDIGMKGLPENQRKLILGAQCNLWTERIASGRDAEYMLFPRAFILADNLWLGENRSWQSLLGRRKAMYDLCYYLDLVCSPTRWE